MSLPPALLLMGLGREPQLTAGKKLSNAAGQWRLGAAACGQFGPVRTGGAVAPFEHQRSHPDGCRVMDVLASKSMTMSLTGSAGRSLPIYKGQRGVDVRAGLLSSGRCFAHLHLHGCTSCHGPWTGPADAMQPRLIRATARVQTSTSSASCTWVPPVTRNRCQGGSQQPSFFYALHSPE